MGGVFSYMVVNSTLIGWNSYEGRSFPFCLTFVGTYVITGSCFSPRVSACPCPVLMFRLPRWPAGPLRAGPCVLGLSPAAHSCGSATKLCLCTHFLFSDATKLSSLTRTFSALVLESASSQTALVIFRWSVIFRNKG